MFPSHDPQGANDNAKTNRRPSMGILDRCWNRHLRILFRLQSRRDILNAIHDRIIHPPRVTMVITISTPNNQKQSNNVNRARIPGNRICVLRNRTWNSHKGASLMDIVFCNKVNVSAWLFVCRQCEKRFIVLAETLNLAFDAANAYHTEHPLGLSLEDVRTHKQGIYSEIIKQKQFTRLGER